MSERVVPRRLALVIAFTLTMAFGVGVLCFAISQAIPWLSVLVGVALGAPTLAVVRDGLRWAAPRRP